MLPLTYLTEDFAVAPQLAPEQMKELAQAGFRGVINNRPDGEGGPGQPTDDRIRSAAEAAGLEYVFLPVVSGHLTPTDVSEMVALLERMPRPLVAFCRSGTRSGNLYRLAIAQGAKR
jgi:uncharacterized protein (TIGR01244 family)